MCAQRMITLYVYVKPSGVNRTVSDFQSHSFFGRSTNGSSQCEAAELPQGGQHQVNTFRAMQPVSQISLARFTTHAGCRQNMRLFSLATQVRALPVSRSYWWSSSKTAKPADLSEPEIDVPPLNYGDLSELGLISWTPAGLVRWSLELVQVTTGMPWLHTILATTLLFRIFLVPISIKSLRNSARLLPMTPRLMAIKDEMTAARESGDMLAMQRVALKQKKIYQDAGVSMGPMLLSPLIQLPVTLGLFFGVKKMCTLPVEQLKQSGLAILPDLTVPDPYFVLPILATALINLQISVSSVEG
jgi:membrane protein insertase Oxa1/YidC/SpoIIIJ